MQKLRFFNDFKADFKVKSKYAFNGIYNIFDTLDNDNIMVHKIDNEKLLYPRYNWLMTEKIGTTSGKKYVR